MTDTVGVEPPVMAEAVAALEEALGRVRRAGSALDELSKQLEAGGKPAEVAGGVMATVKASLQAQDQMERICDALRRERGGDGLDLEAARAEVGRRLDRILGRGDA
jgi:hypothetical protein